jgi:hypothetical protein
MMPKTEFFAITHTANVIDFSSCLARQSSWTIRFQWQSKAGVVTDQLLPQVKENSTRARAEAILAAGFRDYPAALKIGDQPFTNAAISRPSFPG